MSKLFIDTSGWASLFIPTEIYHQQAVDCSSFVVMQQLEIQKALTTDKHFEQAGFVRLLK